MPAKNLPEAAAIETLTSNEVISCLWNKNSSEKCRIGLADAVIYEYGLPARWYMTGKTGEILKKRGVDKVALSQRWLRISQQNQSPFVAIIRQESGIIKLLRESAWYEFIGGDPIVDDSLISVHCFVKGSNNLAYRNKFELKDRQGRFITSTHSYQFYKNDNENIASGDENHVQIIKENQLKMIESKASAVKSIMDLATNTVIRYIERMLKLRVISITVDYIIDTKSQLWMLWPGTAQIVRDTVLHERTIPGVDEGDTSGRMSWAALPASTSPGRLRLLAEEKQRQENEKNERNERNRTPEPKSRSQSPVNTPYVTDGTSSSSKCKNKKGTDSTLLSPSSDTNNTEGSFYGKKEKIGLESAKLQINNTSNSVSTAVNRAFKGTKKSNKLNNPYTISMDENDKNNDVSSIHSAANPFRCRGDYCQVRMRTEGVLQSESSSLSGHIKDKNEIFFTETEFIKLKSSDKNFDMDNFENNNTNINNNNINNINNESSDIISMKSIILARNEKRGMKKTDKNDWESYPNTPLINVTQSSLCDLQSTKDSINYTDPEQVKKNYFLLIFCLLFFYFILF